MRQNSESRAAVTVLGILALGGCNPQREADREAWVAIAESSRPVKAAGIAAADSPVAWRLWWTQQEIYKTDAPSELFTGPQKTDISDRFRRLMCVDESEHRPLTSQRRPLAGDTSCEAVMLNDAAAGYIFKNELWDRRKLIRQAMRDDVHLPRDSGHVSREMKTERRNIQPEQAPRYITALDDKGHLKGLVAFHLMSHELPNWLWATWLHEDCSWKMPLEIGFHDSFGANPDKSASDDLKTLLKAKNAEVLSHYRLIGTQRDFTAPSALGNPMIEGGTADELRHSSCMGCHAFAAIKDNGYWNPKPRQTGVPSPPKDFHSTDFDFSLTLEAACLPTLDGPCVVAKLERTWPFSGMIAKR